MTIGAVRDRSKTVTRRHVDTWQNLKVGDRLTLIEKGMGLAKGEKQVVLAEVEIVRVTVESIGHVDFEEATAEGFPNMDGPTFVEFWLTGHGYKAGTDWDTPCRRIEWKYLP